MYLSLILPCIINRAGYCDLIYNNTQKAEKNQSSTSLPFLKANNQTAGGGNDDIILRQVASAKRFCFSLP